MCRRRDTKACGEKSSSSKTSKPSSLCLRQSSTMKQQLVLSLSDMCLQIHSNIQTLSCSHRNRWRTLLKTKSVKGRREWNKFPAETGFFTPNSFKVSCFSLLILGRDPGERWRVSCWTRRATLPPFCLGSRWKSRRCWGCRLTNLGSDWKKTSGQSSFAFHHWFWQQLWLRSYHELRSERLETSEDSMVVVPWKSLLGWLSVSISPAVRN